VDPDSGICAIEAVGPLLALGTWPAALAGCVWVHFIDNDPALFALLAGSARSESLCDVAGETWAHVAERHVMPWFERVESAANTADAPSRSRALEFAATEVPARWPSRLLPGAPALLLSGAPVL